jgi:hypothetical protein
MAEEASSCPRAHGVKWHALDPALLATLTVMVGWSDSLTTEPESTLNDALPFY